MTTWSAAYTRRLLNIHAVSRPGSNPRLVKAQDVATIDGSEALTSGRGAPLSDPRDARRLPGHAGYLRRVRRRGWSGGLDTGLTSLYLNDHMVNKVSVVHLTDATRWTLGELAAAILRYRKRATADLACPRHSARGRSQPELGEAGDGRSVGRPPPLALIGSGRSSSSIHIWSSRWRT
jgi:hypothetical protein